MGAGWSLAQGSLCSCPQGAANGRRGMRRVRGIFSSRCPCALGWGWGCGAGDGVWLSSWPGSVLPASAFEPGASAQPNHAAASPARRGFSNTRAQHLLRLQKASPQQQARPRPRRGAETAPCAGGRRGAGLPGVGGGAPVKAPSHTSGEQLGRSQGAVGHLAGCWVPWLAPLW